MQNIYEILRFIVTELRDHRVKPTEENKKRREECETRSRISHIHIKSQFDRKLRNFIGNQMRRSKQTLCHISIDPKIDYRPIFTICMCALHQRRWLWESLARKWEKCRKKVGTNVNCDVLVLLSRHGRVFPRVQVFRFVPRPETRATWLTVDDKEQRRLRKSSNLLCGNMKLILDTVDNYAMLMDDDGWWGEIGVRWWKMPVSR